MISQIKSIIPLSFEPVLVKIWYFFRPLIRMVFWGKQRYCPVCESSVCLFLAHGSMLNKRSDVVCPVCLSHDRQRFAWVFFNSLKNVMDKKSKTFLHIAPDLQLIRKFKKMPDINYLSVDLESPHAQVHMDITDLKLKDNQFDIIFCSHVLEHIPDDYKAMSELYRVSKPGGFTLIQVPLSDKPTFEDLTIQDPDERYRLFLWYDHVRLYGPDIKQRLKSVGFHVSVVEASDVLKKEECVRMAVDPDDKLFFCKK